MARGMVVTTCDGCKSNKWLNASSFVCAHAAGTRHSSRRKAQKGLVCTGKCLEGTKKRVATVFATTRVRPGHMRLITSRT